MGVSKEKDKDGKLQPVNKDYHLISSTVDSSVEQGKVNSNGVVSAFKVRSGESSIKPHYFQMDKTGSTEIKGGTIFRGQGTFQIKHGDGLENVPGVFIDSGTGDLTLVSSGRVRIIGENIDLIATGSNENGNININAPEKIQITSKQSISILANSQMTVFSGAALFLEGASNVYLTGANVEAIDGATSFKGSTALIPGIGTLEEIKRAARAWLGG
tara:strand:+ start:57 stop:701 length:645 start_codon:yes stop_codon:yes gene_type:complete